MRPLRADRCGYRGRTWVHNGVGLLLMAALSLPLAAQAERQDTRATDLRDADHYALRLRDPGSLTAWEARKAEVRQKVLLSAGLWPLPERTPLNAKVFDERAGQGFTVSKVYFESLPGYLVTGNLYRPAEPAGPYPAILMPHGHWKYGRLTNSPDGSIPARAIDFARQGFVVLSIDMIGYNDSFQLPHDADKSTAQLAADRPVPYEPRVFKAAFDFPRGRLYGFSLGGLQLWDSIRSLDFLASLPEVDSKRLGVTGASGGATQSLLLMAVDDRVQVAAPVNIIGAAKHPGCGCENLPNLWIDTSTVELAALFAPKPLLLMSATQDPWTNSTPQRELPLLRRYWALYAAEGQLKNVHINAGHNYNAETRAAVYDWFVHHLKARGPVIQSPVPVSSELAALGDLRVFPDKLLPEQAKSGWQVLDDWIQASERQYSATLASAEKDAQARASLKEALGNLLSLEVPAGAELAYAAKLEETRSGVVYAVEQIGRKTANDWLELESAVQVEDPVGAVLLVYPDRGRKLVAEDGSLPFPWVHDLLERGLHLYHVRGYASGAYTIPARRFDAFSWSDAYNRSNPLNAVQDIVTALCSIEEVYPRSPRSIIGLEDQGLPAAFGAAVYGKTTAAILDLNHVDAGYDGELLRVFPVGSLRRLGDLRTALLLLLEHRLTLFNPAPDFAADWYREQAAHMGLEGNLEVELDAGRVNFAAPTDRQ